jgi:hypothetical protein
MAYEGYVDFSSTNQIRGWIFENGSPNTPLLVEILNGPNVIAKMMADQFRQDLLESDKGNGRHAFSFVSEKTFACPLTARIAGKRWKIPCGGNVKESWKVLGILAHSLNFGRPEVEYRMSMTVATPREQAIVARLMQAYHRAKRADPMRRSRKADVWSTLSAVCHQDIVKLLDKEDAIGVANYLRDAHAKGLTFGLTQGEHTTKLLRARPDACAFETLRFTDNLVSLAEFVGVLDVESPEQMGQWAENLHADPQELIARIEKHIGIPVVPPQVMGSLLGIRTRSGVLSGRDLLSLYAALRLKEISADLALDHPSICEIGAGLGGAAFYAIGLGLTRYTLIDLPLINVLQGYYLLSALPETSVCLYGEPSQANETVHVLPPWSFSQPGVKYDLLFNQGSFPEMHEDYAIGYLQQARKNVMRAFFSINQEARAPQNGAVRQTVVRELVRKVGGYERANRFRHWLHAGYVEELFRIKN